MFMQLQGIVFIQLQGNYTIVNFQGNISTQRKYVYSQKDISIQGKFSFIQGIILISRKLYSFKELYSFNSRKLYSFKELQSYKEIMFIQGNI